MKKAVFFILFFSQLYPQLMAQLTFRKVVVDEKYSELGQGSLHGLSTQDDSASIYNVNMVLDSGKYLQPKRAILLKSDSLGYEIWKKQVFFSEPAKIIGMKFIEDRIYLFGQLNPNNPGPQDLFVMSFNTLGELLNRKRIKADNGAFIQLYDLDPSENGAVVLSAFFSDSSMPGPGPGSAVFFELNSDLSKGKGHKVPAYQFSYGTYGFGKYHWLIGDVKYEFDNNFNYVETEQLNFNYSDCVQLAKTDTGFASIYSYRPDPGGPTHTSLVNFDSNFRRPKTLYTDKELPFFAQRDDLMNRFFYARRDNLDTLTMISYKMTFDSIFEQQITSQTITLVDEYDSEFAINALDNHQYFIHYNTAEDSSISFIKAIDSLPVEANCIAIQFPVSYINGYDTVDFEYTSDTAATQPVPWNAWRTLDFAMDLRDSINEFMEFAPKLKPICKYDKCKVFYVTGGGLHCNEDETTVTIQVANSIFDRDRPEPADIVWEDAPWIQEYERSTSVPDTFIVQGSSKYCEERLVIPIDFDQISVNHEIFGGICTEELDPGQVTVKVRGSFDTFDFMRDSVPDSELQFQIYTPGTYPYSVRTDKGCVLNGEIVVNERCPILYYIPNAITPNANGINDHLVGHVTFAEEFTFRIFNRWGTLVFETHESPIIWDDVDPSLLKDEVFVWTLEFENRYKGDVIIDKIFGHITILK